MGTNVSSRWPSLSAVLLYTAFIVYQTLADGGAWACTSPILAVPRRIPRSDALANVVAYVPLGLAFVWATTTRWNPSSGVHLSLLRVVATALAGVAATASLSASLEVVQACQANRVSSLYDLVANVVGGAIGVTVAIALRIAARGPDASMQGRLATRDGRLRLLTGLVALVWILAQSMPWVFAVDVGTMRSNLSFLRHAWDGPSLDGWRWLRHAGAWVAIAASCRLVGRSAGRSLVLLGAAGVASLALQILLDARAPLSSEELAGMVAAAIATMPLMVGAGANPSRQRWGVMLLAGAMTSAAAYQLRPEVGAATQAFSWWPRVGLGGLLGALDYALLFGWLGLSAVVAAQWADVDRDGEVRYRLPAAVVVAMLALEALQTRIAGRGPDVSAPAFTLLAVLLTISVLSDGQGSGRRRREAQRPADSDS